MHIGKLLLMEEAILAHRCTRLASASPDSGEMLSTGSSRPSSVSSVVSLPRAHRRLRMDASCCSWRSALCSGDRQPSHVCSRLERRSLGPAEPTEPTEGPGSDGELDGVRHLCTQRSNGEGVSPSAAAPAIHPSTYRGAAKTAPRRNFDAFVAGLGACLTHMAVHALQQPPARSPATLGRSRAALLTNLLTIVLTFTAQAEILWLVSSLFLSVCVLLWRLLLYLCWWCPIWTSDCAKRLRACVPLT